MSQTTTQTTTLETLIATTTPIEITDAQAIELIASEGSRQPSLPLILATRLAYLVGCRCAERAACCDGCPTLIGRLDRLAELEVMWSAARELGWKASR